MARTFPRHTRNQQCVVVPDCCDRYAHDNTIDGSNFHFDSYFRESKVPAFPHLSPGRFALLSTRTLSPSAGSFRIHAKHWRSYARRTAQTLSRTHGKFPAFKHSHTGVHTNTQPQSMRFKTMEQQKHFLAASTCGRRLDIRRRALCLRRRSSFVERSFLVPSIYSFTRRRL